MNYIFWAIWIVCYVVMLLYHIKRKTPIFSAVSSMLLGVSLLMVCHYFGQSIGFTPQINLFNTMLSLTLGVAGVLLVYISTFI
jgi:hypothetical protein